jgi:hypothetical protein
MILGFILFVVFVCAPHRTRVTIGFIIGPESCKSATKIVSILQILKRATFVGKECSDSLENKLIKNFVSDCRIWPRLNPYGDGTN